MKVFEEVSTDKYSDTGDETTGTREFRRTMMASPSHYAGRKFVLVSRVHVMPILKKCTSFEFEDDQIEAGEGHAAAPVNHDIEEINTDE